MSERIYSWVGVATGILLALIVTSFLKLSWTVVTTANLITIGGIIGLCIGKIVFLIDDTIEKELPKIKGDDAMFLMALLYGVPSIVIIFILCLIFYLFYPNINLFEGDSVLVTVLAIVIVGGIIGFGIGTFTTFVLYLLSENIPYVRITYIILGSFWGYLCSNGVIEAGHHESLIATFPIPVFLLFAILGYFIGKPIGKQAEAVYKKWSEKRKEKQRIKREQERKRKEQERRLKDIKSRYEQYKKEGYEADPDLERMLK